MEFLRIILLQISYQALLAAASPTSTKTSFYAVMFYSQRRPGDNNKPIIFHANWIKLEYIITIRAAGEYLPYFQIFCEMRPCGFYLNCRCPALFQRLIVCNVL
jgi:hypothetical protein